VASSRGFPGLRPRFETEFEIYRHPNKVFAPLSLAADGTTEIGTGPVLSLRDSRRVASRLEATSRRTPVAPEAFAYPLSNGLEPIGTLARRVPVDSRDHA